MNKELVTVKDGVPVTDSLTVATYFGKRHKNVIRDIEKLIADITNVVEESASNQTGLNFEPSTFIKGEYRDNTGKANPMYYMTEDGFHLLAMGFTGKKALEYKLAFIAEFNRYRATVKAIEKPKSALVTAIDEVVPIAQHLTELFGVHDGLAKAKAIALVEFNHDVNLQPVKELLPPADHDVGNLNATQIGELLGWNSPRKVNRELCRLELQTFVGGKWVLTEAGKRYGEMCPYSRNGHTDYQIRWSRRVVDLLANI